MSIKPVPPYIAARRRLRRFVDAVERGEQPDPDDMQELAEVFRGILRGERVDKALGLVKRRGRQPQSDEQAELEFVGVRKVLRLLDQGHGPDKAFTIVAAELGLDRRTIRGWYNDPAVYKTAKAVHDMISDPRFQEALDRYRR